MTTAEQENIAEQNQYVQDTVTTEQEEDTNQNTDTAVPGNEAVQDGVTDEQGDEGMEADEGTATNNAVQLLAQDTIAKNGTLFGAKQEQNDTVQDTITTAEQARTL